MRNGEDGDVGVGASGRVGGASGRVGSSSGVGDSDGLGSGKCAGTEGGQRYVASSFRSSPATGLSVSSSASSADAHS